MRKLTGTPFLVGKTVNDKVMTFNSALNIRHSNCVRNKKDFIRNK